jgi:hypothetical protein
MGSELVLGNLPRWCAASLTGRSAGECMFSGFSSQSGVPGRLPPDPASSLLQLLSLRGDVGTSSEWRRDVAVAALLSPTGSSQLIPLSLWFLLLLLRRLPLASSGAAAAPTAGASLRSLEDDDDVEDVEDPCFSLSL